MKRRNSRALRRILPLGLAAAAVVVPTAQARHADSERAVSPAPATAGYANYYRALALRSEGLNAQYQTRTVPYGDYRQVLVHRGDLPPLPTATPVSADDRAGVRGPGPATAPTPIVVGTPSSGFDWADAGIGAGSALLAIALLGGALLVVTRRTSGSQPAV